MYEIFSNLLGLYDSGNAIYRCTQCGNAFETQRQYAFHFEKPPHKADPPYKCQHCPAGYPQFIREEAFRHHLMTHHAEPMLEHLNR